MGENAWLALGGLAMGAALLWGGGEMLVHHSARLARGLGVSPLLIGLTVISIGTSTPEMLVSLVGVVHGLDEIAVANVVGSNICNTLLILGATACVGGVAVHSKLIRVDIPVAAAVTVAFAVLARDGWIGPVAGAAFLVAIGAYLLLGYRLARWGDGAAEGAEVPPAKRPALSGLAVLVGLGVLLTGAEVMVRAAVSLATVLGLSQAIIGVTVVAVGTSLPELFTCVLAAVRQQPALALGNIFGSNVFNVLVVLGVGGVMRPLRVEAEMLAHDVPVMLATAVLCWPVLAIRPVIGWRRGVVLVGAYVVYLGWIVWRVRQGG